MTALPLWSTESSLMTSLLPASAPEPEALPPAGDSHPRAPARGERPARGFAMASSQAAGSLVTQLTYRPGTGRPAAR
jgi:hypothetical protein